MPIVPHCGSWSTANAQDKVVRVRGTIERVEGDNYVHKGSNAGIFDERDLGLIAAQWSGRQAPGASERTGIYPGEPSRFRQHDANTLD
jgi:hypothetical protein